MNKSLFDLRQDRLNLVAKRHLAEKDYMDFDRKAQKAMKVMSRADNDLLMLEFDIQKAQAEQNMTASDSAWAKIKEKLAF